jgi:hypothetical protein
VFIDCRLEREFRIFFLLFLSFELSSLFKFLSVFFGLFVKTIGSRAICLTLDRVLVNFWLECRLSFLFNRSQFLNSSLLNCCISASMIPILKLKVNFPHLSLADSEFLSIYEVFNYLELLDYSILSQRIMGTDCIKVSVGQIILQHCFISMINLKILYCTYHFE